MRKLLLMIAILVALLGAGAAYAWHDRSGLRAELSDIQFKLNDMERVLRQNPRQGTIDTIRRRVDVARNDLRRVSLSYRVANTFFKTEMRRAWEPFSRVEQAANAARPRS